MKVTIIIKKKLTIIAIALLVRQRRESLSKLAEPLQGALASGGIIILITAAGGEYNDEGRLLFPDTEIRPRPSRLQTLTMSRRFQ